MTIEEYNKLSEEGKIFAHLLMEILKTLKDLSRDITVDIEETAKR